MPYYGSQRCVGCSGEDCVCCEVYLEERAEQQHIALYGPPENELDDAPDGWGDEDYDDDEEEEDFDGPDDSMDGDFDSGMSSAGFGTDEDYDHYETPLGEDYGGE